MRYISPKFSKLNEMASMDVGRLTEHEARTILENIRWPEGITCPHCGSNNITKVEAKSSKVRDGLIQCNGWRSLLHGTAISSAGIALSGERG